MFHLMIMHFCLPCAGSVGPLLIAGAGAITVLLLLIAIFVFQRTGRSFITNV